MCTLKYLNGGVMEQWGPVVGRALLALIFIVAGFGKITGFAGTVGYIASVGLPIPEVLAILAAIVELGGGLMLLTGFWGRHAAAALFIFSLLATILFHNNFSDQLQVTMALKNLAMMGGLLMVMVYGTGAMSWRKEDETSFPA